MKYVFDWKALGGCIGGLIVLALIPVGGFIIYFLFHAILFILPAIVAILIILGIIYAIGYAFKEAFIKKVE